MPSLPAPEERAGLVKLPNAEQSIVESRKITHYLLDKTSPEGADKADFFLSFGFHPERWEVFATALKAHGMAGEVSEIRETDRDIRYGVVGPLETPDGRNPRIKTVWQIMRNGSIPRFITAHPYRRR